MALENPLLLGISVFNERWDESEEPYYGYCYVAIADAMKWLLVFQDRLRMESAGIIVLTNIVWELTG